MADSQLASPGTPHTTASADRRRSQIIEMAAVLFDRRGYSNVSMDQLALAAGIAKPTLYHYFRAKDEILRGIHEAFIDIILQRQAEREALGLSPADLLLGVMTDILELMETHRGHVRVFFEHHRDLAAPVREEIRIKRALYQEHVERAIVAGIESGTFRDVDPRIATLSIFGMCNWAYQWWRPDTGLGSALTAQKMFDLVIRGLAVRP